MEFLHEQPPPGVCSAKTDTKNKVQQQRICCTFVAFDCCSRISRNIQNNCCFSSSWSLYAISKQGSHSHLDKALNVAFRSWLGGIWYLSFPGYPWQWAEKDGVGYSHTQIKRNSPILCHHDNYHNFAEILFNVAYWFMQAGDADLHYKYLQDIRVRWLNRSTWWAKEKKSQLEKKRETAHSLRAPLLPRSVVSCEIVWVCIYEERRKLFTWQRISIHWTLTNEILSFESSAYLAIA